MVLDRFRQSPSEIVIKVVDYEDWLNGAALIDGQVVITAVNVSVAPTTTVPFVAVAALDNPRVSITSSGGEAGITYTISIITTTSDGQVKLNCLEYILGSNCQ